LATSPKADAASGFRAGWLRLARVVGPKLQDWENRCLRAKRDHEGLRMHVGVLLAEVEHLRESRRAAEGQRAYPPRVAWSRLEHMQQVVADVNSHFFLANISDQDHRSPHRGDAAVSLSPVRL
jgi:hypothetical protein